MKQGWTRHSSWENNANSIKFLQKQMQGASFWIESYSLNSFDQRHCDSRGSIWWVAGHHVPNSKPTNAERQANPYLHVRMTILGIFESTFIQNIHFFCGKPVTFILNASTETDCETSNTSGIKSSKPEIHYSKSQYIGPRNEIVLRTTNLGCTASVSSLWKRRADHQVLVRTSVV